MKEESITDRLLFDSQKTKRFIAKAFTRMKEHDNGADWEWWIFVNRFEKVYAYRFLIQAKKIKITGKKGCYDQFNYDNGEQLHNLLKSSYSRKAMPLYMVYSVEEQDFTKMYINCKNSKIKNIMRSCQNCKNGAYLIPAYYIEQLIKGKSIAVKEVLNKALKLSFLDCLIPEGILGHYHFRHTKWMFHRRYMKEFPYIVMREIADYIYSNWSIEKDFENGKIPFCFSIEEIPGYVSTLLFKEKKEYEGWCEREFGYKVEGLAGVAILDLRNSVDISEE